MLFCKEKSLSWILPRNEFYRCTFNMKSRRRRSILGTLFDDWIIASNRLLLHYGWSIDWSRSISRALLRKVTKTIQTSQKAWFWFKVNCILMVCLYLFFLSLIWRVSKGIRSVLIKRCQSNIQYCFRNIWRNVGKITNFEGFRINLWILFIKTKEYQICKVSFLPWIKIQNQNWHHQSKT